MKLTTILSLTSAPLVVLGAALPNPIRLYARQNAQTELPECIDSCYAEASLAAVRGNLSEVTSTEGCNPQTPENASRCLCRSPTYNQLLTGCFVRECDAEDLDLGVQVQQGYCTLLGAPVNINASVASSIASRTATATNSAYVSSIVASISTGFASQASVLATQAPPSRVSCGAGASASFDGRPIDCIAIGSSTITQTQGLTQSRSASASQTSAPVASSAGLAPSGAGSAAPAATSPVSGASSSAMSMGAVVLAAVMGAVLV